jgi:hypothetical protein
VPTANVSRRLSDGAVIVLTVAVGSDRLGRLYDSSIAPDEPLTIDWTRIEQDSEPALQAAVAWLRAQPACS